MVSSTPEKKSPSGATGADCQRFYGVGKKIPRDVKRHCGMCRQHSVTVETRGHLCPYKNCDCQKCQLVRQRRHIMSTQIRLRREQDKKFQRTTDIAEADILPWNGEESEKKVDLMNMCYFCQKCKNHGVLMWKKDHKKNCEYASCRCEQCDLIETRRALDRHIKCNRQGKPELGSSSGSNSCDSSSTSSSCLSSESNSNQTPINLTVSSPNQEIPMVPNLLESGLGMITPTLSPSNFFFGQSMLGSPFTTAFPFSFSPFLAPNMFNPLSPLHLVFLQANNNIHVPTSFC